MGVLPACMARRCVHAWCLRGQEVKVRVSQVAVWVLGIKLGSSARASAPHGCATSVAPKLHVLEGLPLTMLGSRTD